MELKVNTEETEIEELKQSLEIIKKAIERRNSIGGTQKALPLSQETQSEPKQEVPRVPEIPRMVSQQEKPRNIPSIDISALSMSTHGSTSHFSTRNDSSSTPSSLNNIQKPAPRQESPRSIDERDAILEIINNLKRKNPDGPLYMQNIISLANAKGIQEQKTRSLVSELKEEGSI